jgi:large subunit ribosomal protein L24
LVTEDPDLAMIRTVTVRVGDEVEVLRGDFGFPNSVKADSRGKRLGQSRGRAGVKSSIVGVDTKSGYVLVEGVTSNTADGKEQALPIHPSNLIVTKLYDGDPLRIKRIMERANGGTEQ